MTKGQLMDQNTAASASLAQFRNREELLQTKAAEIYDWRKNIGLEGLVKGLDSVIINTEPQLQAQAVQELLSYTGYYMTAAFQTPNQRTCVLQQHGSADIIITARLATENPFLSFNRFPKSQHLPHTRLETFVFQTTNLEEYVSIQQSVGVAFATNTIQHEDHFSFIQTSPSPYTGNSIGFIEWDQKKNHYNSSSTQTLDWRFPKPPKNYLTHIGKLDHAATRVRAQNRDAAILEFTKLTNYNFDFAIYVEAYNSITNATRLSKTDFALVFTSGISPYINDVTSGPTEKFISNYGTRVHHLAFETKHIDATFTALKDDGMTFLIELVGSRDEGLQQTFTTPSPSTLLVTEYIHRYNGFDGFFTKSNVTRLTQATQKQ
jgi:4-hydroxyphenylpyruvate dioxygenase-like putative hemolysin